MTSNAKTVEEYIERLPDDRREAIARLRAVIKKNLPKGFAEQMLYGMICYVVPHSAYPAGYHCDPKKPLTFAGLASQKNYMSLYLMTIYQSPDLVENLQAALAAKNKKLDMGKGCLRFKKLEDLPLDVIGAMFRKVSMADYIERYEKQKPRR